MSWGFFPMSRSWLVFTVKPVLNGHFLKSQKTHLYHYNATGKQWTLEMFIVLWPITAKIGHVNEPQNHKLIIILKCTWLQFSFLTPDWLFSCTTITFQKYFWCSRFSRFDCKRSWSIFCTSQQVFLLSLPLLKFNGLLIVKVYHTIAIDTLYIMAFSGVLLPYLGTRKSQ